MKYTDVKNLRYANAEHTLIVCDVTFDEIGTVPYTPSANDSAEHSREIYARCMAGEFGLIADYVKAPDEYPAEIITNATPDQPQTSGMQIL